MFKRKNPAELQAQLSAMKGGKSYDDDKNEWKLKDTEGVGSAVIRFLPSKNEENPSPFLKLVNHGFKKNGQWYIENCTSTHGDFDSCPVCQHLTKNDSFNTNEAEYKLLKRKTSFWANILVIKDPAVPANEGKVFTYRFGQKIMDKINKMVEVDVELEEVPVDVTCVFEGANFSLKCKMVGGFKNYDDSKFLSQSKIAGIDDEETQTKLIEGMSDLTEMAKFKSFEDNQKKFAKVMGTAALGGAASSAAAQADKLGADLDAFDKELKEFNDGQDDNPDLSHKPNKPTQSDDDGLDDLLAGL
ncbi:single strand DNA binding protein [Pectobacterium bacteriophage PM2]|uniref:Single-stranded DNA-binding protein n=1 Tax=Pectobacterium bacteriophage PM2 TaxID=1429794 RepID=A0A0A0Q3M5_9CAUD|nr:single strand DNA binding protein [Pectobacterium bacteriophage PM2]AHY25227.1 single-stranded DNA binding protein [Pectobacterium bacteriophage PM2]